MYEYLFCCDLRPAGLFPLAHVAMVFKVVSPADGKPFCSIADASVGDVDKAVAAARRAFDDKGEVRHHMASWTE